MTLSVKSTLLSNIRQVAEIQDYQTEDFDELEAPSSEIFNKDEIRRRFIITLNMNKIVQHIWEAIRCEGTESSEPVFDLIRRTLSGLCR